MFFSIGRGFLFKRENKYLFQKVSLIFEEDLKKALQWKETGVFMNFPDRFHDVIKEFHREK